MSSAKNKVLKRTLIGILIALAVIVLILGVILLSAGLKRVNAVDIVNDGSNPFIRTNETLLSAHRAGGDVAPENTMMAFRQCMENGDYLVDTLEFDLHITAPDENGKYSLVLLHDDTLDRTSNSESVFGKKKVYCKDKTLKDLQKLNMGYDFVTREEGTPYRDLTEEEIDSNKLRIVTVEQILDYTTSFTDRELTYVIEIKDDKKLGELATDILYDVLSKYELLDKVVIGTFNNSVTKYIDQKNEKLKSEEKKELLRSASIGEVLEFYFSYTANIKLNKEKIKYVALQVPFDQYVINFGHQSIIDYAHYHNIAMQFWTINSKEKMQSLKERGADMIMTDSPDVCYDVLKTD